MISVDEFSEMIKNSLYTIQNVKVCGEIGKITKSAKQHSYFELKSTNAIVSCVAWASSAIDIQSGQAQVTVRKMDFYPPYGKCQAIVTNVEQLQDETAEIAKQRAELINILHKEGIVDREKNQIPDIIDHLVIITSHGSAAHHDMKQGINARWPGLKTTVIHTSVQGPDSLLEIPLAFQRAISLQPDVIICGRGGGSETDLQVFNEETVIRHFIHNKIPIISAIGHESDHSISDLVADVRAKTPTAAIEIAIRYTKQQLLENVEYKLRDLLNEFKEYVEKSSKENKECNKRLNDTFSMKLSLMDSSNQNKEITMKESIDKICKKCDISIQEKNMMLRYETSKIIANTEHNVKYTFDNLNHSIQTRFIEFEHSNTLANKDLSSYSPHIPLKRGFAFVTKNGHSIKHLDELQENDELCVKFIDGIIDVIVKKCRKS